MNTDVSCPQCGRPVAARALFCHQCGAVQPPVVMDAFARLNLAPRFDLDHAALERQWAGFSRILAPERMAGRDSAQRELAARHRAAVAQAYGVLRDPVSRARALLAVRLAEEVGPPTGLASAKGPDDGDVATVAAEVAAASGPGDFDDVDGVLIGYIAAGVMDLARAFALGDLTAVPRLADRLARWQALAAQAGARRTALDGTAPPA